MGLLSRKQETKEEIVLTKEEKEKFIVDSNYILKSLDLFNRQLSSAIKILNLYPSNMPKESVDNLTRFVMQLEETLKQYQVKLKDDYFKIFSDENTRIIKRFFRNYIDIYSKIVDYQKYVENKNEILEKQKENDKNFNIVIDVIKKGVKNAEVIEETKDKNADILDFRKSKNLCTNFLNIYNFLSKLIENVQSNPNKFSLNQEQKNKIIRDVQSILNKNDILLKESQNLSKDDIIRIKLVIDNYKSIINIIQNKDIASEIQTIKSLNIASLTMLNESKNIKKLLEAA